MPIFVPCEQGTAEWMDARRGIPTASQFGRIYTSTGKASTQAADYRLKLLGAWMSGLDEEEFASNAMAHGIMHEPAAREWYEMTRDVRVDQVGFAYLDETRMVGASSDGLVGDDGLVEIKCPQFGAHMANLLSDGMPSGYIPQVQGNLWILDRQWCDFVSYHPALPSKVVRVLRDEEYIDGLRKAVETFVLRMEVDRRYLIDTYPEAFGE